MAYVYIITNERNGTLYIGVTKNIIRRTFEHKNELLDGFSSRYGLNKLVYVEEHQLIIDAIEREKQLKNWRRAWKLKLIESANPEWRDLGETLI